MEYLSASRIHLMNQCGLSFSFKYIDKINMKDDTTDFYADYGKLMHKLLENIANKAYSIPDLAIRELGEKFSHCNIPDDKRPDYYQAAVRAINEQFEFLSKVEIMGVEKEFNFNYDFTLPKLKGFIDLVYRDSEGRIIVKDYKTSKPYTDSEMFKQFQPIFYSEAVKNIYGEYPFAFEFDFIRFGEKKVVIVDQKFVKLGLIRVKGVWNKIKSGDFQANYNPFFCENFCENRTMCPMFLKKNLK